MRFQKLTVCSLALLVLFTSVAVAQTSQHHRRLDVPYVPTTEEAVEAMLKSPMSNPPTPYTILAVVTVAS
jgi:hypothetical protein